MPPFFTLLRRTLPAWLLFTPAAYSQSFVANPSFETNYNETWPHYGPIDSWFNTGGGPGTNLNGGPFHNVGTPVPDGVQIGFLQGSGKLFQFISGLEAGQTYWIQFFYDKRVGGPSLNIDTLWDGTVLDSIVDVPVSTGGAGYKFRNVPFVPEADGGELAFQSAVVGDTTMLLDGVCIVKGAANQVVVMNPSFEASGPPLDSGVLPAVAGWSGSGTGVGGVNASGGDYANNGAIPDQDLVGFIDGPLAVSQTIRGLVTGETYSLSFRYNAPTGRSPQLLVAVDGEELFSETVVPVGGTAPYRTATRTFTAANTSATLTFEQTADGQAVLLDDIKITGVVVEPVPNLRIGPKRSEIRPGQVVDASFTVSGRRLESGSSTITVRSTNESILRLVDADANGLVTLVFPANSPETTLTTEVEGVERGTATIVVEDNGGHDGVDGSILVDVVSSFVLNPSFEASPMPSGVGYGTIASWAVPDGAGLNTKGPFFFDNGERPDRGQVAFIQGGPKAISQTVGGLTPGQRYALQFFYNARTKAPENSIDIAARIDGVEIASFTDVQPVGGGAPFYFCNAAFVPATESVLLELATTQAIGDVSILFDAVTIVPQTETEIVVKNPSFEATGILDYPGYITGGPIAGWTGGSGVNIDGAGPFTDNGLAGDQDRVGFIQGPVSLSQTVEGLTPGKSYTLSYLVNARLNDTSGPTLYQVLVDGELLLDAAQDPVGIGEPYAAMSLPFTATSEFAEIRFVGLATGTPQDDHSLLLDNIRITPDGITPPQATIPLRITAVGGNAVNLSWPASAPSTLRLQYSTSLLANSWRPLDAVPAVSGGAYNVLDAIDGPVKFYRLYQP